MRRRMGLVVLWVLCALWVPVGAASADVGPKPTLTLRILREGQPVGAAGVRARLLACLEPGAEHLGRNEPLPGLERLDLSDPSGCLWQDPSFPVLGGTCPDGQCVFSGSLPARFRVVVHVPGEDRLYLTDVAERRAMHERFAAELAVDGTAALRADPLPVVGRTWSLAGMALALVLTLAVELAVITVWARLGHGPLRRLLIVGLVANVLTLPAVWLLAGLGYLLAGVEAGLIALAVAEGLAWFVEAIVYVMAGRLGLGRALLLSLAANVASLLVGMVVH